MTDVKRRGYRAPMREAASAHTRTQVLSAAADLFLRQGYVATTTTQIAEQARVSRPTVFSVGSKAQLFAAVRDVAIAGDDQPVPIVERAEWKQMLADPDPVSTLRRYARISAGINGRYAPVHKILQRSADAAVEMAELYERSERERRIGVAAFVGNLASKTTLSVSVAIATDTIWALNATDMYQRLVVDSGWSQRRYVSWLVAAARATVLDQS